MRKSVKKIAQFSLIVVGAIQSKSLGVTTGASGLGKSTFINTLFGKQVVPARDQGDLKDLLIPKTLKVELYNFETEEFGNKLSVTVVDTPGYGDNLKNTEQFDVISEFVRAQFDQFLEEETRIKRNPKFQDTRLHALLYFVSPHGKGLKEMDIQFIRKVGKLVNVIPVIAKADGFTTAELQSFKEKVRRDVEKLSLPVFSLATDDPELEPEERDLNAKLKAMIPFSIIGSETAHERSSDKAMVRGRKYSWGLAQVDNAEHCDVTAIKSFLLEYHILSHRTHLQELKDLTNDVLYENYRTERLSSKDGETLIADIKERESKEKLEVLRSKERIVQEELESKMKQRVSLEEKLKE